MKLIRSDSGIHITDFSWLWGALGFLVGIACMCGLAGNLYRGVYSGQTVAVLFGASFGLGAGIILTQWSGFRFDKVQREVAWRRRSLVRAIGGVIAFERISFAVVQFNYGGGAPTQPKDHYRVALCTNDGIVPLTTAYSNGRVSDDRCQKIRTAINECLGRRLESEDENDIRELQKAGDKLITELFIKFRYNLSSTAAHKRYEQIFS
jgi:hypothetical protein